MAISGVGGLGHVAIQYAKAMGLHVVAIDVAAQKLSLVRAAGADLAVDARSPPRLPTFLRQRVAARTASW